MKSLIRLITILVLISFFASCGKDNKVGAGGVNGGGSTSPINSGNTNLDSFYNKVVSQQFATVYGNFDSVEYIFYDLYGDYDFTREHVKSSGAIYRDDDGHNTKAAIVNFLASIMVNRQNYRAGCNVYPASLSIYMNIFHRNYVPYDCYTFVSNNTTYYIDLNYPLEANPIATIKYSVTQDEWWIFDTWKTTVDGYYLTDVDIFGYYY
ncbi:MAG: hypothetical protein A2381_04785 [Bdellovibrionales bacterium RIFOXYB1_FULL_37_110]|nr:MAG: hypothetical protein A2181_01215 [Bdellovibrionales bacterium RIFOXYA1_FULL_38_20]OFZ50500.1 MAG: hypothetical protein A2417_10765 [Bdellovibrionales bacterium RIFOXYC1_FULL_37_79]OFZ60771.1 MAG: hypothetical protein A2381_04785 [Bdellovibrionales bacterium RIFOXYB1_FULL_37_110]OFZ64485.1 MAG: hypothetical protein A2577_08750 [Bdellovibrionales bacterium RIFOXYD1_FULL_36_51]